MTKEEILNKHYDFSEGFTNYETERVFSAMQEYSNQQTLSLHDMVQEKINENVKLSNENSSLIKEVEELKVKFNAMSGNCDSMGQTNKALCNRLQEQSTQISQLKEANNKLNHAMIEWDTTHPIEAENRELQRKIKELKEALEKIIQARNIHDEETFLYVFDRDFDSYKAALNTQPKH